MGNVETLVKSTMDKLPVADQNLVKLLIINQCIIKRLKLVDYRAGECDEVIAKIHKNNVGASSSVRDYIKSSELIVKSIASADTRFDKVLKTIS